MRSAVRFWRWLLPVHASVYIMYAWIHIHQHIHIYVMIWCNSCRFFLQLPLISSYFFDPIEVETSACMHACCIYNSTCMALWLPPTPSLPQYLITNATKTSKTLRTFKEKSRKHTSWHENVHQRTSSRRPKCLFKSSDSQKKEMQPRATVQFLQFPRLPISDSI